MTPAIIKIFPQIATRGVYYIGQYGTCGYASAARGYLYHYYSMGIPITWEALKYDDSELSDNDPYNVVIKSLIDKKIDEYDIVILHSTPDLWPKFRYEKRELLNNKFVIGCCCWETNKLPDNWAKYINNTVNELWVASKYNEDVFKNCGVERPIKVVPYVFLHKPLPPRESIRLYNADSGDLISNGTYTFYSIGEFNERKSIVELIDSFCQTFTSEDKVRLILKLHYKNYSKDNKEKCKQMVNDVVKKYSNHPKIIGLFDNMTNDELTAIHSLGDCYISLTKSEAFGLTIFDAFNYHKDVIATGYSGQHDFLGENHPGLVKYKLGPIKETMTEFSAYYNKGQEWAYPDLEHAKELMKNLYVKWSLQNNGRV